MCFMNNKLIIGIAIAIVVTLVIISVMLNSNYLQLTNTAPQVPPVANTGSPRHLSINLVENMKVAQHP